MPVQRLYPHQYQQINLRKVLGRNHYSSLIYTTKSLGSKGKEQGHKQVHVCLSPANIQPMSNLRRWLQQLLALSGPCLHLPTQFQPGWHIYHWADLREEPWKLRQRVTSIQMNPQEKISWNVELVILSLRKRSRECRRQLALLPEAI